MWKSELRGTIYSSRILKTLTDWHQGSWLSFTQLCTDHRLFSVEVASSFNVTLVTAPV